MKSFRINKVFKYNQNKISNFSSLNTKQKNFKIKIKKKQKLTFKINRKKKKKLRILLKFSISNKLRKFKIISKNKTKIVKLQNM